MQFSRRHLFALIVGAFASLVCGSKAMSRPLTAASLGPEKTPFPPNFGLLPSSDHALSGACSNTECLVVWAAQGAEGGQSRWLTSFVGFDGKPAGTAPTLVTTAPPGTRHPIVATDGLTYVLVWGTSAGLVYRQIDAAGKWLQPAAIEVPDTASAEVRLTWTGTQFLLITRTTKLTVTSLFSPAAKPRLGPPFFRQDIADLAWFNDALWILTRAPSSGGAPAGRLLLHKLTLEDDRVSEAAGSPVVLASSFGLASFVRSPAVNPDTLTAVHTESSVPPETWRLVAHRIGPQGMLPSADGDVLVPDMKGLLHPRMTANGPVVSFVTGQSVRRFDLNTGWVDEGEHALVSNSNDQLNLVLNSPQGFIAFASPPNAASLSRDVCVGVFGLSGLVEQVSCKNALSVAFVGQRYVESGGAPGTALVAFADDLEDGFALGTLSEDLGGMAAPWGANGSIMDVSHGAGGFRVLAQKASDRLMLAVVPTEGPPTFQTAHDLKAPAWGIDVAWGNDRGMVLFQPASGSSWPQAVVYRDNGTPLSAPVATPPLLDAGLETIFKDSALGANADAFLVTWVAYSSNKKLECRLVLDRYDQQGAFLTRAILPPEESDCAGNGARRVFAQIDGSFLVAFATPRGDRLVNLVRVTSDGLATSLGSAIAGSPAPNASFAFAAFDDNKVVVLQTDGSSTLSGGVVTVAAGALSAEPFAFALPHAIARPALTVWSKTRLLLTYESFDPPFGVATIQARFMAVDGTILTPGDGDAGAGDSADAGALPQSEADAGAEGGQHRPHENPHIANDGGCGCSVGGVTKQGAWPAVFLLLWLVTVRRRARTEDR